MIINFRAWLPKRMGDLRRTVLLLQPGLEIVEKLTRINPSLNILNPDHSSDKVEKPVAKRFCWEEKNEAQLLLVSNDVENAFFSQKVAQTGSKSFWLRINDQKVI